MSDWWARGGSTIHVCGRGRGNITERQTEWDAVVSAFTGRSPKPGADWIRAACPMCEEASGSTDTKESLGFNTKTGGFNCLRCESKGRLPDSHLEQLEGVVDLDLNDAGRQVEAPPLPPEAAHGFVPLYGEAGLANSALDYLRAYVRGRGIPDATARAMTIGTGTGALAGRVVVPLVDPDGTYRGWYGRDATGSAFVAHRYAKHMVREGLLYNARQIERETDEPLFLVEGCLKTISVWPNAVAFLGKPLASHVEPLLRARRPLVVCLDGDAWREGQAFAWTLSFRGVIAENVRLPPKIDPDELPRVWLLDAAASALKSA